MMGIALVVSRLFLASVFLLAGIGKLWDLAGSRQAVAEFGVPERLAGVAGTLLPLCELTVAVALVPTVSARFGALGAVILLVLFCAAIARALARGLEPDCHCFGQVHSAPAGWGTLGRNAALLAVAGFVAIAGWESAGVSATRWVTRVQGPWLMAIAAGLMIVGVVGFMVWFCLQLLAQNGRMLGRVEALEARLDQVIAAPGLASDGIAVEIGQLPQGLEGGGLAVGSRAPEFELVDLHGERRTLGSLLSSGRRLVVMFSDAGCGPCNALLPEVAVWQHEHRLLLELVVVASGDRDLNRAKAAEYGLGGMLLQTGREVSEAYEAHGTPAAVVIDPDGRIASPTVAGVEAIRTLVAQASRPLLAIQQRHPASNGDGGASRRERAETSRVGEPAPQLVLNDLHGRRVALKDLYTHRILVIFWNPGCGFCEGMLDDLKAFEDQPPEGSPRLLVISAGDPDDVREQEIRSIVLLDPEGEAMAAFDAHGTPMGILIDRGQIASHVAAGADAVFALARDCTPSASIANGAGR